MSQLDLNNPQVRRNFLVSQIKEGRGEFMVREQVVVFRGLDGSEYVAPEDLVKELDVSKLKVVATPKSEAKPKKATSEETTSDEATASDEAGSEEETEKPQKKRTRKSSDSV